MSDRHLEQERPATRAHPRIVAHTRVEVRVAQREELLELWTRDLSKGGLFVETDEPLAPHTRLQVVLATPSGQLELEAEVVHVLERAHAQAAGLAPGLGLQILDLTPEKRAALDAYLNGITDELYTTTAPVADAGEALDAARALLGGVDASDLYAALALEPGASHDEVKARIAELARLFEEAAKGAAAADATRLGTARRVLDRVAALLLDPLRRATYDFRAGHFRVEERLADPNADLVGLRKAWTELFPQRIRAASKHVETALGLLAIGRPDDAVEQGEQALELDPFNAQLRRAVAEWAITSALAE